MALGIQSDVLVAHLEADVIWFVGIGLYPNSSRKKTFALAMSFTG
jgi:hypothetical protein